MACRETGAHPHVDRQSAWTHRFGRDSLLSLVGRARSARSLDRPADRHGVGKRWNAPVTRRLAVLLGRRSRSSDERLAAQVRSVADGRSSHPLARVDRHGHVHVSRWQWVWQRFRVHFSLSRRCKYFITFYINIRLLSLFMLIIMQNSLSRLADTHFQHKNTIILFHYI